jgi:hypothetical protein
LTHPGGDDWILTGTFPEPYVNRAKEKYKWRF